MSTFVKLFPYGIPSFFAILVGMLCGTPDWLSCCPINLDLCLEFISLVWWSSAFCNSFRLFFALEHKPEQCLCPFPLFLVSLILNSSIYIGCTVYYGSTAVAWCFWMEQSWLYQFFFHPWSTNVQVWSGCMCSLVAAWNPRLANIATNSRTSSIRCPLLEDASERERGATFITRNE
jgi:hypothetical protein